MDVWWICVWGRLERRVCLLREANKGVDDRRGACAGVGGWVGGGEGGCMWAAAWADAWGQMHGGRCMGADAWGRMHGGRCIDLQVRSARLQGAWCGRRQADVWKTGHTHARLAATRMPSGHMHARLSHAHQAVAHT
eukprot:365406-Chlamydomonas_euryale.AAC.7